MSASKTNKEPQSFVVSTKQISWSVGIIIGLISIVTAITGFTGYLNAKPGKDDLQRARDEVQRECQRIQTQTNESISGVRGEISVLRTDMREMRGAIDRILVIMAGKNTNNHTPSKER